jgi:hypothetical protein
MADTNWGITAVLGTSGTGISASRAMGGTFPNETGKLLKSVVIRGVTNANSVVRLGVYQGGDLTTGPVGATRIEDLGTVQLTSAAWVTANSATNPALTANAVTWVAFKSGDNLYGLHYSNSSADAGNYQTERGRWNSANSPTATTAYAATWPADAGSFPSALWYSIYLIYMDAASGVVVPVGWNLGMSGGTMALSGGMQ